LVVDKIEKDEYYVIQDGEESKIAKSKETYNLDSKKEIDLKKFIYKTEIKKEKALPEKMRKRK
jgi:hypothetical protein